MSLKKQIAIGLPAFALLTLAFAPFVHAQTDNQSSDRRTNTDRTSQVESMSTEDRSARIAEKRSEIRAKLEEMKKNRAEKLDARRLQVCETREEKINSIIQKRSEQATKHLAVFQRIAGRVQEFVSDKNLTIEGYDELVSNIEAKEADAEAAIEANSDNTFDCNTVDGAAPAKLPRESFSAVNSALKEYRTAIKDLIVKIKAGQDKTQDTGGTGSDDSGDANQGSTEQTEGGQ